MLLKAVGETCPIMKLAIQADIEVRAVALARMAVFMISTGLEGSTLIPVPLRKG